MSYWMKEVKFKGRYGVSIRARAWSESNAPSDVIEWVYITDARPLPLAGHDEMRRLRGAARSMIGKTVRQWHALPAIVDIDEPNWSRWIGQAVQPQNLPRAPCPVKERAEALFDQGYFPISSKHRTAARIDRANWLEHMAIKYSRSVADFYVRDSKGALTNSTGQWSEHYCRVFSEDRWEGIEPDVYAALQRLWRAVPEGPSFVRPVRKHPALGEPYGRNDEPYGRNDEPFKITCTVDKSAREAIERNAKLFEEAVIATLRGKPKSKPRADIDFLFLNDSDDAFPGWNLSRHNPHLVSVRPFVHPDVVPEASSRFFTWRPVP